MSEGIQFRLNAKQMNQQNNGRIKKKKQTKTLVMPHLNKILVERRDPHETKQN